MTTALSTPYQLPAHARIPEPQLLFSPDNRDDVDEHPLKGLDSIGPYSRDILGAVRNPIRLALIAPDDGVKTVDDFINELERSYQPKERTPYLIAFRGFNHIFRTRVTIANTPRLLLGRDVDTAIDASSAPHQALAERLAAAVNAIQTQRTEFDVLLIYLPKRWQTCFTGVAGENFDLHDFVKGHTASLGIPAQIVREDKAISYHCRCSVMWRIAIALYCKAGGIPWKLAYTEPDTMHVGLGYAMSYDEDERPHYLTTCSQVFDHDGTGLEFIAYETRAMVMEGVNPYLNRQDMHRIMTRSIDLYQRRHGGKPPKSVVVHKVLPFKAAEIDGCFDAFRAVENVELLQIQKDTLWRGAHLDPPKTPNTKNKPGYACLRGTMLLLGGDEALLWTQGNVPQGTKDYFKEGKGTPRPLLIRRFAGRGPFSPTCRAILGLTKMDWNNDALYDRLPVTQRFASDLAQMVKRMPTLTAKPYPFRLFM